MSLVHNPFVMPKDRTAEHLKEDEKLRAEVADLRDQIRLNQQILDKNDHAVSQIRLVLRPLYDALRHLFEQMDEMGTGVNTGTNPRNKAVWDSWKQKLGGKTAAAIDVLMMHGEMNAAQLRIHLHCSTNYVFQIISQLNKASLINKNKGKISLKDL